MTHKLGL
jgi:hypothetical protein